MNIPIELGGILFLIFIFLCWLIYLQISKLWLRYKYKPNNDKSRLGEEARRNDKDIATAVISIPRPPEPSERSSIQITGSEPVRKDSKKFRGFFKRTRK